MIVDFGEQVIKQVIEEVKNREYLSKINDLTYSIFIVSLLSLLFSGILFISGIDYYNGLEEACGETIQKATARATAKAIQNLTK